MQVRRFDVTVDGRSRQPMVMCRSCGRFVAAMRRDGGLIPLRLPCPECGGTEFRDIHAE